MISGADLIEVESVSVERDFVLVVTFNNGKKKTVDLSRLLKNPPPVFSSLPFQPLFFRHKDLSRHSALRLSSGLKIMYEHFGAAITKRAMQSSGVVEIYEPHDGIVRV